jgi:hypothetical protein
MVSESLRDRLRAGVEAYESAKRWDAVDDAKAKLRDLEKEADVLAHTRASLEVAATRAMIAKAKAKHAGDPGALATLAYAEARANEALATLKAHPCE